MPDTWWLSRLCEAFSCLPSQAWAEWQRTPEGLLADILEARAYVETKTVMDRARTREEQPSGPMADLVRAIEFGLVAERITHAPHD